eukprot:116928_1
MECIYVGIYAVIGPVKRGHGIGVGKCGIVKNYTVSNHGSMTQTEQYVYEVAYFDIDKGRFESVDVCQSQLKDEFQTHTTRRNRANFSPEQFGKLEDLIVQMFVSQKEDISEDIEVVGVAYCYEFGSNIFRQIVNDANKRWNLIYFEQNDNSTVNYNMTEKRKLLKHFVTIRVSWSKVLEVATLHCCMCSKCCDC